MINYSVLVDADAVPSVLRDVIVNACIRYNLKCCFVANFMVNVARSEVVDVRVVENIPDEADRKIISLLHKNSKVLLVITNDLLLSEKCLFFSNVKVLNFYGEFVDGGIIGERVALRNFSEDLRNCGIEVGKNNKFGAKDKHNFANKLDVFLNKNRIYLKKL